MIVIADSSPLRYLVLIEESHLLPALYGRILVPPGVVAELTQPDTPKPVRNWIEHLPDWARIQSPCAPLSDFPTNLGLGERQAIALAEELRADVLLADDAAARQEAGRRQIPVQGTLGVLDLAAAHHLVDLSEAIQKLSNTNFRASRKLFDVFRQRDAQRKRL